MLAASRASSSKASKAPIIAPATVAEDSAEPLRSVVSYSPEIAFIVVDEVRIFDFASADFFGLD